MSIERRPQSIQKIPLLVVLIRKAYAHNCAIEQETPPVIVIVRVTSCRTMSLMIVTIVLYFLQLHSLSLHPQLIRTFCQHAYETANKNETNVDEQLQSCEPQALLTRMIVSVYSFVYERALTFAREMNTHSVHGLWVSMKVSMLGVWFRGGLLQTRGKERVFILYQKGPCGPMSDPD